MFLSFFDALPGLLSPATRLKEKYAVLGGFKLISCESDSVTDAIDVSSFTTNSALGTTAMGSGVLVVE